jgi:hypothetical protein
MKSLLICDIKERTLMSYGPRQRCSEGRAAQSGSHPAPRTRATARGCRPPGSRLVHLQAPSLSLSPTGSAAQTTGSRGRRQSLFYGQAFAPFSGKSPDLRRLDGIDTERDHQPGLAGSIASWGRPWLTARQVSHERCGWNINLIVCGRRSWRRPMNALCLTRSGSEMGHHCPEATRRF